MFGSSRWKTFWLVGLAMLAGVLASPVAAQDTGGDAPPPLSDPLGSGPLVPGLEDDPQPGQAQPAAGEYISFRAIPSHTQVTRGQTFYIALEATIEPNWVYYSPVAGGSQLGAEVIPLDLSGAQMGTVRWEMPKPKVTAFGDESVTNYVYDKRTVIFVPITVPRDLSLPEVRRDSGTGVEQGSFRIALQLDGQVCGGDDNICLNLTGFSGERFLVGSGAEIGPAPVPNPQWTQELQDLLSESVTKKQIAAEFGQAVPTTRSPGADTGKAEGTVPATFGTARAEYGTWVGLGLALVAGLILNIMPCVLPIIPLRIYSLVNMAGQSRRRFVTLGLAFAMGIVLFFAAVGLANVVVKLAVGRALNWSEHWQYAGVRAGLGLVLVALATNLFGAFNVTVPQKVASIEAGERKTQGHAGAAGMGLMMAILSTPCSAALVAGLFTWAQGQSLAVGTLAIVLMGVGMAAPHAVLAAFPDLVKKLPKPGRWMEIMKQAMGFVLLPVAIWLFSTLRGGYAAWVMAYAVVLAFALWMWGSWVRYDAPAARRWGVRGAAVALAVGLGVWMLRPPAPPAPPEVSFAEKIDRARQDGQAVVVKFTADWCLECKVVEANVYQDPDVKSRLSRQDVAYMVGDVTDRHQPAVAVLSEYTKAGPPMTLVYPPGEGEPIALPGGISVEDLMRALDAATRSQ